MLYRDFQVASWLRNKFRITRRRVHRDTRGWLLDDSSFGRLKSPLQLQSRPASASPRRRTLQALVRFQSPLKSPLHLRSRPSSASPRRRTLQALARFQSPLKSPLHLRSRPSSASPRRWTLQALARFQSPQSYYSTKLGFRL